MSRGYGKYKRGGGSHASFQFENLFKENSNRPSAARSAATVGKWGITSFTSIRTVNGLGRYDDKSAGTPAAAAAATTAAAAAAAVAKEGDVPKPKKFFKSRDPPEAPPAVYSPQPDQNYGSANKRQKNSYGSPEKDVKSSAPKKFFSSKNNCSAEKTVLSSNANNAAKRAETKPPIVLRICRGKSQLVSDSEESESTPTPSSTPSTSTSPRALREHPKSPGPVRITRSTRRSMQQDPNSSPATADTPGEFSLFSSPKKDIDLSPQYIPAEKYELERKAMYDNLLGSSSPKTEEGSVDMMIEDIENEVEDPVVAPQDEENKEDVSEEMNREELLSTHELVDVCAEKEEEDSKKLQEYDMLVAETAVDFNSTTKKLLEEPLKKKMEEDWSSDSDSNSTAPENNNEKEKMAEVQPPSAMEEPKEEIPEKPPETAPPVKLIISKKKGSIFKSRSMVSDGGKKRHALYKHKWCDDKDTTATKTGDGAETNKSSGSSSYDFDFKDDPLVRVTRSSTNKSDDEAVTGVKCTKNDKGFYTVVRNVKKAHQIQEIGEFQEFNDDVDYILDALQDNNPISTRCLSAITLASKCMVPAFRMHVRAHGTVGKFFKALHDATKDQSLGLCTATVMFVLSQDRLNMDLDRDCLELMLNLLESDVSYQQALDVCGLSSAQLEKNKQKVRELCGEIQSHGHAMHLNLDNITVGQLAMETLLSLTSKRAGEWFKEELRELGGLEHIMKTICECCRQVSDYVVTWTDVLLDKLRKVDRCMRVLENVTHNNEENQTYLLKYNNGEIIDTLVKLYRLCDAEIPLYPVTDVSDKDSTGTVIREALLVTLKVLINLTHHFNKQSVGSSLVGSRPGIIDASLHLLLQVPHYIPDQKKFELGILVLMLLINLIQDNEENKKLLINAKAPAEFESRLPCDKSAVEALIVQFYQWEEYARLAEKRTNAILDGEKDEGGTTQHKSNEEFIEETVAKLLQKAGTHMEFTFLASYTVMLLGFLIMDNQEYLLTVRHFLKRQLFTDMVEILKKFFNFMSLTASTEASSVCAIKATEKVIKFLEDCDTPPPEATPATTSYPSECMDLSFSVAH